MSLDNTIMKMGVEARIEIEQFGVDTFGNLLQKYKSLQASGEFVEAALSKLLNGQIEITVRDQARAKGLVIMFTMLKGLTEEFGEQDAKQT